jgi:hypothetical protein
LGFHVLKIKLIEISGQFECRFSSDFGVKMFGNRFMTKVQVQVEPKKFPDFVKNFLLTYPLTSSKHEASKRGNGRKPRFYEK